MQQFFFFFLRILIINTHTRKQEKKFFKETYSGVYPEWPKSYPNKPIVEKCFKFQKASAFKVSAE